MEGLKFIQKLSNTGSVMATKTYMKMIAGANMPQGIKTQKLEVNLHYSISFAAPTRRVSL